MPQGSGADYLWFADNSLGTGCRQQVLFVDGKKCCPRVRLVLNMRDARFLCNHGKSLTGVGSAVAPAEFVPRAESLYCVIAEKTLLILGNFWARYQNFPLTLNLLTSIVKRRTQTGGAQQPCACLSLSLLLFCFSGPHVNRKV